MHLDTTEAGLLLGGFISLVINRVFAFYEFLRSAKNIFISLKY